MRWAAPRRLGKPGTWTHEHIQAHDLLDDTGVFLGYIYHDDRAGHGFTPYTSLNHDDRAQFPTQSTLKDAKVLLLAHFVAIKLE